MTEYYNCKYTPEEADRRIDEIISYCDANNVPPLEYVTLKFGISNDDLLHWAEYEGLKPDDGASEAAIEVVRKKKGLANVVKKLRAYREFWYFNQGKGNPKIQALMMFALKQQSNGGWSDKEGRGNQAVEITVKMGGMDSSEAFG